MRQYRRSAAGQYLVYRLLRGRLASDLLHRVVGHTDSDYVKNAPDRVLVIKIVFGSRENQQSRFIRLAALTVYPVDGQREEVVAVRAVEPLCVVRGQLSVRERRVRVQISLVPMISEFIDKHFCRISFRMRQYTFG